MNERKSILSVFLCYLFWGFQPLYWAIFPGIEPFTILACRIIMAAVFSTVLLAVTGKLSVLRDTFRDGHTMKRLLPAAVFLFADWAVFIVVVGAGHVIDAGLGYYINPLILFAVGVVIYKEKCTRIQLAALCVAAVGVIVSTVAFGAFPYISLFIAANWAVYAAIKKNVKLDGVVSIAVETLILTPFAAAFLLFFRRGILASFGWQQILFMVGGGIVTALPMFLYSNTVSALPLIFMCFAQYLSPTFNLVCSLILHEDFTSSQLVSLVFFVAAIVVFTVSQIRQIRKPKRV